MNRISKITYAFIIVLLLFLLPVTYADSSVLVSISKDGEAVSSAEVGSIVKVTASVENPKEGDVVSFDCTNSTLSFINEETGEEYGEDEEVKKEVSIDKDGKGTAEVSAKVLTNAQIEVNATVSEINPDPSAETETIETEETPSQDSEKLNAKSTLEGQTSQSVQTEEATGIDQTNKDSADAEDKHKEDETQNTQNEQLDSNSSKNQDSNEQTVPTVQENQDGNNQIQNAQIPETTQNPKETNGSAELIIENIKQQEGIENDPRYLKNQTSTQPQNSDKEISDETQKNTSLDTSTTGDGQSQTEKTADNSSENSKTESTELEQKDSTSATKDTSKTSDDISSEKTDGRKLEITTDSTSVEIGKKVKLQSSIQPETDKGLLENVVWTISYSEKEITPGEAKGETTEFTVPEDALDKPITISAYIPKEVLKTDEDLRAQDITLNTQKETLQTNTTQSGTITVKLFPSTDSKIIKPGWDVGFSSEIVNGETIVDPNVSKDAKYNWYAQLDNTYLNGSAFGSTYSVCPTDNGELKVWVAVTLNDGSVIESDPVIFTISDEENTELESITIAPAKEVKEVYSGEEITFTPTLNPKTVENLENATYQWIVKVGDQTIAEGEETNEFAFTPIKSGTYSITLTITLEEGKAIVSDPYELTVLENPNAEEEQKLQMIPENQNRTDQQKATEDETSENADSSIPSETQPVNIDSQKETSKTDSNQSTNPESSKSTQSTNSSPLKLLGAEIVTKEDVDHLEVGKALTLDAEIKTEGGAGEVTYSWKATDAEGKVIAESNKLDNFTVTVDRATDVTVVFEVKVKNPKDIPIENQSARAEKVFSFKSAPAAVANSSKNNPDSAAIQSTKEPLLVADNFKQIDSSTSGQNNSKSSTNQSSQSTSTNNTTKSTGNQIGNSTKSNTTNSTNTSSSTGNRNSSSSKAVGSTPAQNNGSTAAKSTTTVANNTTSSSSPSSLSDQRKTTRTEPSKETLSSNGNGLSSTKVNNTDNGVTKGIKDALSTSSPFINPKTGVPFTIAEVGTFALLLLAGAGVVYGLLGHKDDDSNDYYL